MTPIQITDPRFAIPCDCDFGNVDTEFGRDQCSKCSSSLWQPVSESDLLSVLTDEALEAERLRRFHLKLAEQREKGWTDFHPEKYCHRCGHPNIESWWVASGEWNLAVRNEDGSPIDGYPGSEIICPQCFVEAWDQATSLSVSWEVKVDPLTDKRLVPRPPSRIPYAETDDLIGELVKRGVLTWRMNSGFVVLDSWRYLPVGEPS